MEYKSKAIVPAIAGGLLADPGISYVSSKTTFTGWKAGALKVALGVAGAYLLRKRAPNFATGWLVAGSVGGVRDVLNDPAVKAYLMPEQRNAPPPPPPPVRPASGLHAGRMDSGYGSTSYEPVAYGSNY